MKTKQALLGLILFGLGFIGVLSTLTMDFPLPAEAEAVLKAQFTPQQIKLLLLINPTLLLLVAVVVGTVLYQKAGLKVPFVEKAVGIEPQGFSLSSSIKYGIVGGIFSGVLLSLITFLFNPIIPAEFKELGESVQPNLAVRFLYGGLTEEVLMRFGLMTLIVWLASKAFGGLKPISYWLGIAVAAILFALGHLPIAYQAVAHPSTELIAYVIIGNSVGGLVFGWLYWKKGLESAFLAHIFTHVVMVLAGQL